MNSIRKFLALLLCVGVCLSLAPKVGAEELNMSEYNTLGASTNGIVKAKLDELLKKYPVNTSWTDSFNGKVSCYGFAHLIIYELFGKDGSNYRSWNYAATSVKGMEVVGKIQDYSLNELKNLLLNAKPGDILQFSGNKNKQHSAIIYSVQEDSAILYECNWAGNCLITLGKNSPFSGSTGFISVRKKECGNTLALLRSTNYDDVNGSDSPDLTVTANDATGVTANDATLTGFIHYGNYQPTQWGVDCGTSSDNLSCVIFNDSSKQAVKTGTGMSISFSFKNDSTSDPNSPGTPYYPLKANTTYFYRFWVKYGEDQFAHSDVKQFTTGNATIPSFSNINVTKITDTTAQLNYSINYGADNVPKYYGVYLGTSEGGMTKAVLNMKQYNESTYVNSTDQPIAGTNLEKKWPSGPINGNSIAFGSEGPTLSPATTYYYKLWITDNSGDHEYCSAVQSFTTSGSAISVTGVSLNTASLTMTGGTSQKLTATVSPSNATNKNITWSSSNPSVAAVSSDGVVNAVQGGTATITATTTDGGKTASCTVTVKDVHIYRFEANGGSGSMSSTTACLGDAVAFPQCAFTRPGYNFLGWYAYRVNDGTFFAADVGWRTEEAIAQAGQIKQIYPDRLSFVMDASWTNGVIGPCTFIMYAVWEAVPAPGIDSGKWGNLFWTLDSSGALTISGTGAMADFDEDSSDAWLVHKESIVSAVIESGVTSIGDGAFSFCTELSSVTIPDGVTSIGEYAFNYCCSLENITIPDSVTSIGERAFEFCNYMTNVTIPDSVTSIGDGAFSYCGELTSVAISNNVTSIGDDTFLYCGLLESVTIPDGVTSIGDDAFNTCGMRSVTIPDSVTSIGDNAFTDCFRLQYVFYGGTQEQWDAISVSSNNDSLHNATIIYKAYVLKFDLPASLTAIEEEAFAGGAFSYVRLPEDAETIGSRAFADCPKLRYIYIPEATTGIAGNAFDGVSNLTIIGQSGSYAEFYAQRYGYSFTVVE